MMRKILKINLFLGCILFISAFALGLSLEAAEAGYEISWWTVDVGGGESLGEGYTLKGTIGQPDAGSLDGGDFSLHGGFWARGIRSIMDYLIHLPLIMK